MNREILAERPLNLPINPSPEDLIAQNDIYNTKSNQLDENTIEEYMFS